MTDAQQALAKVREALRQGSELVEWEWWTSNSLRRLSVRGSTVDGGVMYAHVARDGHPDISIRQHDMDLIAACSPANVSAILAHVQAQEAEIERLRKLLCKCDMRTRLVGDGCEFCNPQLADELAKEQR